MVCPKRIDTAVYLAKNKYDDCLSSGDMFMKLKLDRWLFDEDEEEFVKLYDEVKEDEQEDEQEGEQEGEGEEEDEDFNRIPCRVKVLSNWFPCAVRKSTNV